MANKRMATCIECPAYHATTRTCGTPLNKMNPLGARSEVAEGVIVETGSVLSMGVYIGASTKIIDRQTGEVFYGRVPAYSVVVPGSVTSKGNVNLYAAIIVKKVDEKTRSKTSINELLRE